MYVQEDDTDVAAGSGHDVEQVGGQGAFERVAGDTEQAALEGELTGVGFTEGCGQDSARDCETRSNSWAEPTSLRGPGLFQ
jgi:hypothetical protein